MQLQLTNYYFESLHRFAQSLYVLECSKSKAINKVLLAFNYALLCAFSSTLVGGITVSLPSTVFITMGAYHSLRSSHKTIGKKRDEAGSQIQTSRQYKPRKMYYFHKFIMNSYYGKVEIERMRCDGEIDEMLRIKLREAGSNKEIFTFMFYSTYEFDEVYADDELQTKKIIKFRLGGHAHSLTLLEFACRLGLYHAKELDEEGFNVYFQGVLHSDEHFNTQEHQNGYANVAWLIARWMKRKGAGTQKESQICCGQFIMKLARKARVLSDEPRVPRVAIPRPPRTSMQDLYERMGSMEIRHGAIERMAYREIANWELTGAKNEELRNEDNGNAEKWHNGTSSRTISTETSDGLAAIQAQLNNLGREIKKVNEKSVRCSGRMRIMQETTLHKGFSTKGRRKNFRRSLLYTVGAPYQPGGQYRAARPGFYQRSNGNSSYPDRRPSLEESLTKFMAESAKRHEENSNIIKKIRASTDAAIRNQRASIKTLEIQIGQMSNITT
ncbi:hypothetical protein Tco_1024069 [Tanacetum coccineum]